MSSSNQPSTPGNGSPRKSAKSKKTRAKPKPGRKNKSSEPRPITRGMLQRFEIIHAEIKAVTPNGKKRVTRQTLMDLLEMSESSIKRDLHDFKFHFNAPIDTDFRRNTLYYLNPNFEMRPPIWLDADEASAVLLTLRTCTSSRVYPFGAALDSAAEKIVPTLASHPSIGIELNALVTVVSVPSDPLTLEESQHFETLRLAATYRRVVRMVYTKAEADAKPETRLIHPLHLVVRPDGCILIAHAPEAGACRNFDLVRISSVEPTGETFEIPKNFNLKEYLAGGLDRFFGPPRYEVKIRFSPSYTPWVKKHAWQRGQTFTDLPDGSSESTFRIHHLREMVYFVLRAAGQAEVVSPVELRTMVRDAAEAIVAKHAA